MLIVELLRPELGMRKCHFSLGQFLFYSFWPDSDPTFLFTDSTIFSDLYLSSLLVYFTFFNCQLMYVSIYLFDLLQIYCFMSGYVLNKSLSLLYQ